MLSLSCEKFEEFIESLPDKDADKLLALMSNIENQGMLVAQKMGWVDKLDKNLYEIRSKQGSNIQRALYFHKKDNKYFIVHGFTKKTQKTPKREIERGKRLRDNFLKGE